MTFDVREAQSKAREIYPPFEFVAYDGETYELPHAKMFNPAVMAKMQDDDPEARTNAFAAMAPEAWSAIQQMEPGVMLMVIEAWQEHCGLNDDDGDDTAGSGNGGDEVGKAQRGSSGPNRAARRSKQTSRSGASTSTRSRSGRSKAASGSS